MKLFIYLWSPYGRSYSIEKPHYKHWLLTKHLDVQLSFQSFLARVLQIVVSNSSAETFDV